MRALLDTSVLVAAFYADHEHHGPSFALLAGCRRASAACAAHTLAEVYATLTGMRAASRRTSGDQALLFLGSIRERLAIISLGARDYAQALAAAAAAGLSGGAIYDALIGYCALKAGADAVYTWNTADFRRLPGGIAARVRTPAGG